MIGCFALILLLGCHSILAKEICYRGARGALGGRQRIKDATDADFSGGEFYIKHVNAADYTFEIENPHTPLQHRRELQTMTIDERKQLASTFYYALLGESVRLDIDCKICDLVFIAKELVMGDPKCYFTCSGDMILDNFPNLPTDMTLEVYLTAGVELVKNEKNKDGLLRLANAGRALAGKDAYELQSKKRLVFLFPVVMGVMGAIINVGALAITGWAADRAERNGRWEGKAVSMLSKSHKIFKATGSGRCFSAMSSVNVKLQSGEIVMKRLRDVNVGDHVESIEPSTGLKTFTQVYYMAHDKTNLTGQLHQVYFQGPQSVESLALSDRHLIYITKKNQPITNAPMYGPIRADEVEIGDWVWVTNGEKLEARPVVDIILTHHQVRHPLTANHHIIVNGVHASVHILNENLYRALTLPLRVTYWLNPSWNSNSIVHKLVRVVENIKEPFFNSALGKEISRFILPQSMIM